MKKKKKKFLILFNASVIIAGTLSPSGASGNLITFVKDKKINGLVSETILAEVKRHVKNPEVKKIFLVVAAPQKRTVRHYAHLVIDEGDAHVLAAAKEFQVDFLVSLDKKHILSLKKKIKDFQIVSPAELIHMIRQN